MNIFQRNSSSEVSLFNGEASRSQFIKQELYFRVQVVLVSKSDLWSEVLNEIANCRNQVS